MACGSDVSGETLQFGRRPREFAIRTSGKSQNVADSEEEKGAFNIQKEKVQVMKNMRRK